MLLVKQRDHKAMQHLHSAPEPLPSKVGVYSFRHLSKHLLLLRTGVSCQFT